jgi:hypothetical protein
MGKHSKTWKTRSANLSENLSNLGKRAWDELIPEKTLSRLSPRKRQRDGSLVHVGREYSCISNNELAIDSWQHVRYWDMSIWSIRNIMWSKPHVRRSIHCVNAIICHSRIHIGGPNHHAVGLWVHMKTAKAAKANCRGGWQSTRSKQLPKSKIPAWRWHTSTCLEHITSCNWGNLECFRPPKPSR